MAGKKIEQGFDTNWRCYRRRKRMELHDSIRTRMIARANRTSSDFGNQINFHRIFARMMESESAEVLKSMTASVIGCGK